MLSVFLAFHGLSKVQKLIFVSKISMSADQMQAIVNKVVITVRALINVAVGEVIHYQMINIAVQVSLIYRRYFHKILQAFEIVKTPVLDHIHAKIKPQ